MMKNDEANSCSEIAETFGHIHGSPSLQLMLILAITASGLERSVVNGIKLGLVRAAATGSDEELIRVTRDFNDHVVSGLAHQIMSIADEAGVSDETKKAIFVTAQQIALKMR